MQRRVYDALNVLSALDIITKDRNKITFKGYQHLFVEEERHQPEIQEPSEVDVRFFFKSQNTLKFPYY